VRLAFVGDMAMVGWVAEHLEKLERKEKTAVPAGYPFAHVADRLRAADLAIGNLECVVSDRGEPSTWHAAFRAPVGTIPVLLATGFDAVSVANNHSMDWGREAFDDMLKRLDAAKLPAIGRSFRDHKKRQDAAIVESKGIRFGFLGYEDVPTAQSLEEIRAARPGVDVLVVFNHWGFEGDPAPILGQARLGRAQLDAGADLVVGTHAHVLQPNEVRGGKLIAYGLGNFVFSGMNSSEKLRVGGFLEVEMKKTGMVRYQLFRTRLDEYGAPKFVDEPKDEWVDHAAGIAPIPRHEERNPRAR